MYTASVALATYNGEKYIKEQLESIANQSVHPVDVVIADDGSTDHTVQIISKFIDDNHLSGSWELIQNHVRLGCDKNFVECAKKTTGEIIFFSDQDDVWDIYKIEQMLETFESYQDALAVTCRSALIDSFGEKIKKKSDRFTSKKTSGVVKYNFREQVRYNRSAGLEIAFKRSLLLHLESLVYDYELTHDQPVGMIASVYGGYYELPKQLLLHRIHNDNLSNPSITIKARIRNVAYQIESNKAHLKHMVAFRNCFLNSIPQHDADELDVAIRLTSQAIASLRDRDIFTLGKLLFNNNDMINKWICVNNFACALFGDYRSLHDE